MHTHMWKCREMQLGYLLTPRHRQRNTLITIGLYVKIVNITELSIFFASFCFVCFGRNFEYFIFLQYLRIVISHCAKLNFQSRPLLEQITTSDDTCNSQKHIWKCFLYGHRPQSKMGQTKARHRVANRQTERVGCSLVLKGTVHNYKVYIRVLLVRNRKHPTNHIRQMIFLPHMMDATTIPSGHVHWIGNESIHSSGNNTDM